MPNEAAVTEATVLKIVSESGTVRGLELTGS